MLFKTIERVCMQQKMWLVKFLWLTILKINHFPSWNLNVPYLKILKNPGNRNSVFSSRNYGASIANSDQLLFLDDDILITPESIQFAIDFQKQIRKPLQMWAGNIRLNCLIKWNILFLEDFSFQPAIQQCANCSALIMGTEYNFWIKRSGQLFSLHSEKTFTEAGGYEERHLHEGTDWSLIRN